MTKEEMKKINNMDLCPLLKPILGPTYGIIVYQEQVMLIFQALAGYSLGRADLIRRAMSKKKKYVIDENRNIFIYGSKDLNIPGCVANGVSADIGEYIYDQMEDFSKYAFNKAHSTAYGITAYRNMYLAVYHPAELFAATINHADKIEKVQKLIYSAEVFGVKILPPSITNSKPITWGKNKEIRFGLSTIKGVGKAAYTAAEKGPYQNVGDFILRGTDNKGAFEALVDAGALDDAFLESNFSRATYKKAPEISEIFDLKKKLKDCDKIVSYAPYVIKLIEENTFNSIDELKERLHDEKISFPIQTKTIPTRASLEKKIQSAQKNAYTLYKKLMDTVKRIRNIPDNERELLINEYNVLGIFVSGSLLDSYEFPDTVSAIDDVDEEGYITLSGIITNVDTKGNFDLQDRTGTIRCHIFKKDAAKFSFNEFDGVIIDGKVSIDDFRSDEDNIVYQMIPSKIITLAEKKQFLLEIDTADFSLAANMLAPYKSNTGAEVWVHSNLLNVTRHYLFRVNQKAEKALNLKPYVA